MSLNLTIKEGKSFFLNDVRVSVHKVYTVSKFKVMIYGQMGTIMEVGPNHRTELLPGVFATAGVGTNGMARIMLEAPQNVRILREHHYPKKA